MITTPTLDPSQAPDVRGLRPMPARLEIVDRHKGPKFGDGQLLVPNMVRVNGVPLWCPVDDPIQVEEITVDGRGGSPVTVTLRLQARALRIGEPLSRRDPVAEDPRCHYATVELPYVEDGAPWPYAIVDGIQLQLAGPAVAEPVEVSPEPCRGTLLVVRLPLLCRSVVFDDEPDITRAV